MYEWSGAGHMGGMWLWWIVGIAVIAALVWAVARSSSGTSGDIDRSPEEILKRRYAEGKIDKDEYAQRLQDLRR
jgi:putative membrane protein